MKSKSANGKKSKSYSSFPISPTATSFLLLPLNPDQVCHPVDIREEDARLFHLSLLEKRQRIARRSPYCRGSFDSFPRSPVFLLLLLFSLLFLPARILCVCALTGWLLNFSTNLLHYARCASAPWWQHCWVFLAFTGEKWILEYHVNPWYASPNAILGTSISVKTRPSVTGIGWY